MASAFVCASVGIVPTVRHTDDLGAVRDVLRGDKRAIVRAASRQRRRPSSRRRPEDEPAPAMAQAGDKLRGHLKLVGDMGEQTESQAR